MEQINDTTRIDTANFSIHTWIRKYRIKNEKGDPIEFKNHLFLYDIYRDQSPQIVCMKAAQIGFSTLAILKNIFDAWSKHLEIIYTLSTDHDAAAFVSGKVDRIVANNPILKDYVADKDSVEQKSIGKSMIYFKGTHTKKAAITITADRLVHDEKDSSKLDVIADYQSRLQHSKYKQTHVFSHPSLPETGIHNDWLKSDQKRWYITCPHCKHEQTLSWHLEDEKKMSIDIECKEFVCKKCRGVIDDKIRATGRWKAKYPERKISGYWIPLLIAPWVSAEEIIAVVDHGGDLIGSRKFYQRWPGRVFLCTLTGDRSTKELVSWKTKDEHGAVTADRNRMIQFVIDHFREKRIRVHGTENDWYEYWTDWNNLSKMKVLDPDTNQVKGYKFVRSGRDHRALATIFWAVGMDRFSGVGAILNPETARPNPNSYFINPDETVSFDPLKTIYRLSDEEYKRVIEESLDVNEERYDWRNT